MYKVAYNLHKADTLERVSFIELRYYITSQLTIFTLYHAWYFSRFCHVCNTNTNHSTQTAITEAEVLIISLKRFRMSKAGRHLKESRSIRVNRCHFPLVVAYGFILNDNFILLGHWTQICNTRDQMLMLEYIFFCNIWGDKCPT